MIGALSRVVERLWGKRSLDAAGAGRRWGGAKGIGSLNAAIAAGGGIVRQRSAYFARNNPWLTKGINAAVANIVGTGIKPQSLHPDPGVRAKLEQLFGRWSDYADITGRSDFYGLQAAITRSMIETGEAFARFQTRQTAGNPVPFHLQLIAADQVDPNAWAEMEGSRHIRWGVEMNDDGRPTGYWVNPYRPGDIYATTWKPVRIDAADMLHVFEALDIGQVRGLSWLASVLLRVSELDGYEDAQLVRQKVAALFTGFIVDPNGDAAGIDGARHGSVLEATLEPGTMQTLPPGYDVKFSDPAQVGDSAEFVRSQLRAVAAGLGITYEQLTGDFSQVNYSSLRAGLVEFRRRIDSLRWTVLIPQFCQPVWERFIRMAVLAGRIPAAAFEQDPESFLSAAWHPQAWAYVDPTKDVAADISAVEAGFKSRSMVINDRGDDPENIDREIADDQERARKLGISFPGYGQPSPPTTGPEGAPPP